MSEYTGEKPILLIKKMGGVLLLVLGFVLTAWGFSYGANGLATLGILLLAVGIILLVMKIFRRNQP